MAASTAAKKKLRVRALTHKLLDQEIKTRVVIREAGEEDVDEEVLATSHPKDQWQGWSARIKKVREERDQLGEEQDAFEEDITGLKDQAESQISVIKRLLEEIKPGDQSS